jgi:hypothetical protein
MGCSRFCSAWTQSRCTTRVDTERFVPEVVTILPRLRDAESIVDLQQIVHEELRRWYGSRLALPSAEHLHQAATDIWLAWQRFLKR